MVTEKRREGSKTTHKKQYRHTKHKNACIGKIRKDIWGGGEGESRGVKEGKCSFLLHRRSNVASQYAAWTLSRAKLNVFNHLKWKWTITRFTFSVQPVILIKENRSGIFWRSPCIILPDSKCTSCTGHQVSPTSHTYTLQYVYSHNFKTAQIEVVLYTSQCVFNI